MAQLFITFIIYAFIGWLWETVYCSFKARHFVYRGFLLGPYCPVYGFAVVSVPLLVPKNYGTLLNLYFNTVVIVTLIEYVTSWLLEKLFNMQLWNYKEVPLNIEGRVAVPVSMFWGIGCVFLIKVIQPVIHELTTSFLNATANWGVIVMASVFILDLLSTLTFTYTTKAEVAKVIDQTDTENAVFKEYRLAQLFKNRREHPTRQKLLYHLNRHYHWQQHTLRRITKNYPNIYFKKKS
ncbi:putative ABC transporter permease [Vagococcus zengguangii]|uniref:Uncharacterized protein n=1 Tax=Vagococcus zengguangii TaxID=2571750 RepID=A0A4D7CV95_9ENTE|nr:hypothetical protein [Vagococcus zengguangii]QCI87314.1 hypothetical protein FA707_01010 [Vagococcus zengguangii]TLG79585.1 hypothetical protein FE258_08355 [Vagococcus zengguangii]